MPSQPCSNCAKQIPGQDPDCERFEKEGWKYGFGVCRLCGGLGLIFDDPAFLSLVGKINALRLRYAEKGMAGFPLPQILVYQLLLEQQNLLAQIRQQFIPEIKQGRMYILKVLDELAFRVLNVVQRRAAQEEKQFRQKSSEAEAFHESMCCAYRGNLQEALALLKREAEYRKGSLTSLMWGRMGYFYMVFLREIQQAKACYKMASIKSESALDLVRYMVILKKENPTADCWVLALRALACKDISGLCQDLKAFLNRLKNEQVN